ncbi:hypothetical protein PENSPDRAFT_752514 [Peniophora sp. CONT]|nr:hypothetical protein PENSPDRAFT_752514 [Peniophora sp. CONT]
MPPARRRVQNPIDVPEPEEDVQSVRKSKLLRVIFYLLASGDPARLVDAPKNSPERAIRRSTRINTGLSTSWRLRGWFVVAHVCARWRALSLGQPALWTVIDINLGPSWVDAFIARSDPLPFVFRTKPKGFGYNKPHAAARNRTFNNIIHGHASRMGQLNLDTPYLVSRRDGYQISTTLPEHFFQTYPALETLALHGSSMNLNIHSWESFSAPRIQKLSLHGIKTFPWTLAALSRITHLVVRSTTLSNTDKPKLEACLFKMLSLERLYLSGVLPDERTERKLYLPCLQQLGLRDAARRLQIFLQSLDAPSLRSTETSSTSHVDIHVPFNKLISSTLTHVPAANFADITVVRSVSHPRVHISLRASQREEEVGPPRTYSDDYTRGSLLTRQWSPSELDTCFLALDNTFGGTGDYTFDLSAKAWPIVIIPSAIPEIPETISFPFPHVQTARLIGDWKPQEISEAFSTMTGVKHLRLYDSDSFSACSSALSDSSSGTLFPQLETLSIAYSEASKVPAWFRLPYSYGQRDSQELSAYARLKDTVNARSAIGIPLRALYFHQADAFISAIRKHASSNGTDCSAVVDLIQEDPGMRRWYDSEKKQYTSNDPKWC